MTFGLTIVIIATLGFISNLLNNKYLNYSFTKWLYFLGAFIHESSHAMMCVLTGAKIVKMSIFSSQPRITHLKSRIPILGQMFISLAPIAGGFAFIFFVNKFVLNNFLSIETSIDLNNLFFSSLNFLSQINIFNWKGIVILLLLLNSGAMIGPSTQDIKNIWPIMIIMFFIKWNFLTNIGIAIACLILANIIIQVSLILLLKIFKK